MKNLLAHSILAKALALLALTFVLCLPLAQIGGLIDERGASQQQAAQELASTYAGPQVLVGPVIVLPYVESWTEEQRGEKGELKGRVARSKQLAHLVFPDRADLRGKLTPQERYRGIFKVLFYDLDGQWSGSFPAFDSATLPHSEKDSTIEPQAPVFAFALNDARGIQGAPALQLAGERLRFEPRVPAVSEHSWLAHGIHAPLAGASLAAWDKHQPIAFDMKLAVVGQERLAIAPLAHENTAHLSSPWPHPSFGGDFLAVKRTVGEQGFEADWAVSSLVTSARKQVQSSLFARDPSGRSALDTFDVSLAQPVNVYSMSNRAVKYGVLFISLVLMATFMFEIFRKLRLHPVQYGLVGLSLALFFLLLLALSEKIGFALAYAAAAGASVLLLVVYFSAVLRGWGRGVSLGAFVGVLYGALYGLLTSESNALLLGSLLLFGLLAVLMLATRRVDWYAIGAKPAAAAAG